VGHRTRVFGQGGKGQIGYRRRGVGGTGPWTHNKRQATQHDRLPRLLGDGDKGIEKVYGEDKNILDCAD
jgi:hypothetical protein